MQGIETAQRKGKPVLGCELSLLWYVAQHQGAFCSVGGGISVATCTSSADFFSWPIVEFSGRRFLRSVEVTAHYRPSWPPPEVVHYDEAWCTEVDQRVATNKELVVANLLLR
jgi:hypothetical protein